MGYFISLIDYHPVVTIAAEPPRPLAFDAAALGLLQVYLVQLIFVKVGKVCFDYSEPFPNPTTIKVQTIFRNNYGMSF